MINNYKRGNHIFLFLFLWLVTLTACSSRTNREDVKHLQEDTIGEIASVVPPEIKRIVSGDIIFDKALLYEKYTLDSIYPYKDTVRMFQWDKIRVELAKVERAQQKPTIWGVVQNRKNTIGEAPLVKKFSRNSYKNISDTLGVERFQSAPLYLLTDTVTPEIYTTDGTLLRFIAYNTDSSFIHVGHIHNEGEWLIPPKYIKLLDPVTFERIAVVDRTNQNMVTLEKDSVRVLHWHIRSMNPVTTGQHRPPYQHETPLGIFVVQEKKTKMYYYVDGTTTIAGYSPWASRFSNGGYIHGIPVNLPHTSIIEYSNTLGTTPRSHMCVRTASSHAEFFFDWAPVAQALVVVIE